MITSRLKTLIFITASALLSGCAAKGEFPSLLPRAFERPASATAPMAPPVALTPSDSARLARLNASVREAEASMAGFDAALAPARQAVAGNGGGQGSESWIAAQMAVSRLERTRADAESALAEIDTEKRLLLLGPASEDQAALDAAWTRASAINTAQASAVRALLDGLNQR